MKNMNRTNHKSLDLHGCTHEEAETLVDEFIIKNINQLPLEIITGNSVDMLEILRKIVSTHNLKLIPSNSFNMGSYLVTMPLYID